MFKTVLNWFGYAILVSALVLFTGCGGTESGIEGEEEVIAVELKVPDSGDSSSNTLGEAIFHYIFYCPTCPPGADETYIIDSYSVQYVPLKSPDRKGDFFFPPQLVSLDQRTIVNRIILSKDFKTAATSLILISVNTKEEFVGKSDIADTPKSGAFYDILVYFHGRNRAGGSFTTTSGVQVDFGNYNNIDENGDENGDENVDENVDE